MYVISHIFFLYFPWFFLFFSYSSPNDKSILSQRGVFEKEMATFFLTHHQTTWVVQVDILMQSFLPRHLILLDVIHLWFEPQPNCFPGFLEFCTAKLGNPCSSPSKRQYLTSVNVQLEVVTEKWNTFIISKKQDWKDFYLDIRLFLWFFRLLPSLDICLHLAFSRGWRSTMICKTGNIVVSVDFYKL